MSDCNQRYFALLDRQEQQIIRLEQNDVVQESFHGVRPSINGFYAIKVEPPLLPEPIQRAAMVAVV
ncbi:hypothetical protein ACM9VS_05870 [Legionella pneumophila]|uniref:hypothetical protein n=1 Tax=Legionella pneumophila TaxID=446 RepID=UPI003A4C5ED0